MPMVTSREQPLSFEMSEFASSSQMQYEYISALPSRALSTNTSVVFATKTVPQQHGNSLPALEVTKLDEDDSHNDESSSSVL